MNGSTHETDAKDPDRYQISSFQETDIPIELPAADNKPDVEPVPVSGRRRGGCSQASAHAPAIARWYWIEFHRRLRLAGRLRGAWLGRIPLGLSSKKGGKSRDSCWRSSWFLRTTLASLIGVSLARQGSVYPGLGVWLADLACLALGIFLMWRSEKRPFEISALKGTWASLKTRLQGGTLLLPTATAENAFERASTRTRFFGGGFPMILDDYVLRDFIFNFGLIVGALTILSLIFTVFELLGDILKNQVSPWIVGEYLLNVTPYFLYNIAQYGVLLRGLDHAWVDAAFQRSDRNESDRNQHLQNYCSGSAGDDGCRGSALSL